MLKVSINGDFYEIQGNDFSRIRIESCIVNVKLHGMLTFQDIQWMKVWSDFGSVSIYIFLSAYILIILYLINYVLHNSAINYFTLPIFKIYGFFVFT